MSGQSSIKRLPPAILAEVNSAIQRGATVDQIKAAIEALGGEASRSAVGRYAQEYRALAARLRDQQSVAKAFAAEFGDAGSLEGRLLIQLGTTIATRMAMNVADNDDPDLSMKELMEFGRAVKDFTSASKIDVDREAKIRAEAFVKARQKAADEAEAECRAAGASDATIDRVKRRLLGMKE
ncbi:MAG TPA: phage protein Gp27 family protein [Allosphingosinicella sp.]|nr:phage protein Gp27 family protein [Allosphingosinicella sp.]